MHRFHLDKLSREWFFWPSGFVEAWGTKQNRWGLQCQNHWPLIHQRALLDTSDQVPEFVGRNGGMMVALRCPWGRARSGPKSTRGPP